MAEFEDGGLRFEYPEDWSLEREENECGWTVSIQSPGTAFLMVCLREDTPSSAEMADAALEAMREDYPELEWEDCLDSIGGQAAIGHTIRFFSLDLTNTCWLRSFTGGPGTLLVMWQSADLELEEREMVLRAICVSLSVEE